MAGGESRIISPEPQAKAKRGILSKARQMFSKKSAAPSAADQAIPVISMENVAPAQSTNTEPVISKKKRSAQAIEGSEEPRSVSIIIY